VTVVEICDCFRVGYYSLFFEVSDESVADLWGDHIGQGETTEEYELCAEDHESHEWAWLGEFEEGEEMHAFVVGLL
jgi:hypothetical protein